MVQKRWELYQENSLLARRIAEELAIRPLIAQILINRGVATIDEAKQFFETELVHLWDPFLFTAMDSAVDRLLRGIEKNEKIVIFGDYDVDGITGTSLLWRVLTHAGARVDYYIPDRSEGYGMNPAAVQRLAQGGYTLIVTVDNGISCYAEVELANSLGVDVIITDHHEPPELIPRAYAVINPKVPGSGYPFPYLAGVGVGFKFCQAVALRLKSDELMQYIIEQLDLVTLGTIADIVPLVGENRIIAANGLKRITHSENPGIRALIQVAEIEGKEINAGHVGFVLGPRINAIGRMDNPCLGVELLTTHDPQYATELADQLNQANRKRQMMEEVILKSAVEKIEQERLYEGFGLVLASDEWHHGIIGIAASKLVDRYYRPTILISIHEGIGKGSARSIRGLNLYEALHHCQEHLIGFGGHDMAAGLSIHIDQIKPFTEAFQRYVESVLKPEDLIPYVKVDAAVQIEELDFGLLDELQRLEPHGPGNSRPILELQRVAHEHNLVGANRDHLKLQVMMGDHKVGGIGFGMGRRSQELQENPEIDVIFQLERNHWQGRDYLQMMLTDLRPAELCYSERLFIHAEKYLQGSSSGLDRLEPTERIRRRKELAETSDVELVQNIRHSLHFANSVQRKEFEETLFHSLLLGKSQLMVDRSGWGALQTMWIFGAYQSLRWGRATVILCSTRSRVEWHYQQMQSTLQQLGLVMHKATGSLTRAETLQLMRDMSEGEIDILLTTPAYLETHLDKYKLLKDRVGFFALDGADELDAPADFGASYPGLTEWMVAPGHPSVLITTTSPEELTIETIQTCLAINEVVRVDELWSQPICVDRRRQSGRDAYLAEVLANGEKSLIWVYSRQAAVEVATRLRSLLPGKGVLYYHEGLRWVDQEEIYRLFQMGEAQILVATNTFGGLDIADIRHIFFYHLSTDEATFFRQCRLGVWDRQTPQIHLLYQETDQASYEALLSLRAPERERLVKIYVILQKLAGSAGVLHLSPERLAREFDLRAGENDRLAMDHALEIFAELRLLDLEEEDGLCIIRMLPKPKQKLDLSSSIRYNEGIVDKNVFHAFCQVALDGSTAMIMERFILPVFPERYGVKEVNHNELS